MRKRCSRHRAGCGAASFLTSHHPPATRHVTLLQPGAGQRAPARTEAQHVPEHVAQRGAGPQEDELPGGAAPWARRPEQAKGGAEALRPRG